MSDNIQLTTHELWIDGRKMSVQVQQDTVTPSTLHVTWTLPPTPYEAYDGAVVLLSEIPFSAYHAPEDGKRYTASSNWSAPADSIGEAQVVAAFYGYFGDVITNLTVAVTNTDPSKIYYASIHAASNILQYYPIGVQSYPLESSRFEKSSDSYAGSIPTATAPPANPVSGQAYYDPVSNKVLIWNSLQLAWVEGDDTTVQIGDRLPIVTNQVFFNQSENALKFFIGGQWVNCNSTNTRIKYGASWVPLGTLSSQVDYPTDPAPVAGDIICLTVPPPSSVNVATFALKVFTLGQWLNFSESLVQFETTPGVWTNVEIGNVLVGALNPIIPKDGQFFYITQTKDLYAWGGEGWEKSDTAHEGTPTTDKIGIGTDGSYDERLRLIKVLKGQMGYPATCIEINEEQFNIAIDNALETFRQRADNAYAHRYVMFTIMPGQQSYYLNDPRTKTDKIVNIIKIGRANLLGQGQINDPVFGQLFIPNAIANGQVDLVSMHLMHQMSETFEKIFAANLMYTWDESSRQLYIHRNVQRPERVVLEVVMERTEQELLLDRWCKQWLQGWALAELKETLGLIRTKYSAVAGPNGGVTLNGDLLMSEARLDFEDLQRQLNDYEVGNGGTNFGNTSFFIG
jgi:hypothetical protein